MKPLTTRMKMVGRQWFVFALVAVASCNDGNPEPESFYDVPSAAQAKLWGDGTVHEPIPQLQYGAPWKGRDIWNGWILEPRH